MVSGQLPVAGGHPLREARLSVAGRSRAVSTAALAPEGCLEQPSERRVQNKDSTGPRRAIPPLRYEEPLLADCDPAAVRGLCTLRDQLARELIKRHPELLAPTGGAR